MSEGAERLLEVTADELAALFNSARMPLFGVHPDQFYRSAAESLAAHTPWRAEFGYIGPKTARRLWLRASDFPCRTPDGVRYFVGVITDLTAQFAVEMELTLSEERLRTALRASRLLAWDLDRHSGALNYSDHCGEFHGVPGVGAAPSPEEARRVIHPDDRERVQAELADALTRGDPYAIEYRGAAPDADGRPRWFVSNGQAVFDSTGQWVRRLGVVSEVTARKRAEAEREELDRQLNEARRYESLGVLAGGIAHDFNNLLTVILGNAAVVRAGVGAGPLDGPLADIEAACKRAAHLCSQMTAYAGVGRMAVGPVDAAALLRQSEPTLRADAAAARFTLTAPPALPPLCGEPFQIRQAVRNLVTNAAEATPPGGWVKVEAGRRVVGEGESGAYVLPPPAGEYLMIRVADSGCGMTPAVKAKAFDPFFSTKFAGRGLGLAAVLGIVRGHRGGVRLSSAPDRGTVVELLFPVVATTATPMPLPPPSGAYPPPTSRDATPPPVPRWPTPPTLPTLPGLPDRGRVLVCDDELNIRELIASVLEGEGFQVVRAKDGADGVAASRREGGPFVLAVVDLVMPGMGGHDVIRHLRQTYPGLPAVLVTGFADRELPADVRTTGPTALLPKPFRLEQLTAMVSDLAAQPA
jgi:PAS domain S-box-containing protein